MASAVEAKGRWVEGLRIPLPMTLAKYGLNELDWRHIAATQGYACGLCHKRPTSGVLYTDHEHVRRYRDMPPEKRRLYVRGLICYMCNRFHLARTVTVQDARDLLTYLERYERRKPRKKRPNE